MRPRRLFSYLVVLKSQSGNRQVPVFNELQVLSPSALSTFVVALTAPDAKAMAALEKLAKAQGLLAKDWSTVRV